MTDRALEFAAWLTTRPGVMTVGAGEHAGPMAEAVQEWCVAHPAPAPSEAVAWELDGDRDQNFATVAITEAGREHALATGRTVRRPLYTHPAPAREVTEAARALVAKISEIHAHPAYTSLFTMAAIRGNEYSGPTYEAELIALTAALTPDAEGGR